MFFFFRQLFLANTGGTCQLFIASVSICLTFLLSEAFEEIKTFFPVTPSSMSVSVSLQTERRTALFHFAPNLEEV